jgi:hypothetical protein
MASERRCGPMAQNMKENGRVIRPTVLGNWSMLMATSTKDSGETTRLTVMVHILMLMVRHMLVNG